MHVVKSVFSDVHEEASHVLMHDDFWNEEPLALNMQKVDELLELIELLQTYLERLLHTPVFQPELGHHFLQCQGVEIILVWSILFNLKVNFVVLMIIIFQFDEVVQFQLDATFWIDDEHAGGEVDASEFVGFLLSGEDEVFID